MTFYSATGTAATNAAETAKTAAETAKTAAEAAQAAVELLHDDFDDRYLGAKASDPTVDNDGNALAAGTMYFRTTTTRVRVYSGSSWDDITAVQGALITGNNLSDLTDDGAARTNLGLGTAATQASSAFATAAQADQTVALTAGTGITTSGTYPNFTIANSAPDQTVALTGAGATTISGTYPNFTITSTNTTYTVGDNGLTQVNFTTALNTKLTGIETSADVTDTANVVAALTAGSNITIASDGTIAAPLAGITYANSWVDSGNNALLRLTPSSGSAQDLTFEAGSNVSLTPSGSTLTIASTDTTYSVTDGQLSENNFNNTLKSKLDNIEALADVTDTTNVTSAGAVMKTNYSAGSFLFATNANNPESKNATQVRTILNVADGANNFVHPTHAGDDFDIDTGGLSGATVISDLDINLTTDTLGHVVDANATVATRNITLANIGYTGTTDATTNDTDANLKARANHTGTQAQSTVTNLVSDLAAKQASLTFGLADSNAVQINSSTVADNDFAKFTASGLEGRDATEMRSDLNVANGATANDTDANLKARANHTGTQAISTVSGLQTALDSKVDTVSGKGLSTEDFTTTLKNKVDGIEAGAQVTNAANVTAAGAVMDSEVDYLAAIKTLNVPVGTTISNFAASVLDDSNAFDMRTTLGLSAANIKTIYEGNSDTNALTDSLWNKLNAIESNATADQTSAEIAAGYNYEVQQVTSSERTAGTSTSIKRFAPADIASMVTAHAPSNSYSLPTATSSALGGVKVGDTLEITNGVLDVKGLVYSDSIANNSSTTVYTGDGYTFKWDAFYMQLTLAHSSSSYISTNAVKVDGATASPSTYRTAFYLSTSGGGDKYFTTNSRNADWDMEEGAYFRAMVHDYYGPAVGYKIEALRTGNSVVIQIWKI